MGKENEAKNYLAEKAARREIRAEKSIGERTPAAEPKQTGPGSRLPDTGNAAAETGKWFPGAASGPDVRRRRALRILGVTAAVYLIFRCLLPLVLPFALACAAAVLLKPSAEKAAERLRFRIGGRRIGIAPCVIGMLELCGILAVLGAVVYFGGKRLYSQGMLLMEQAPVWLDRLNRWLTGACHQMEERLALKEGSMVHLVQEMLLNLRDRLSQGFMPYLMGNSMAAAQYFAKAAIVTVLFVVGVILFIREMEEIRRRLKKSVFWPEYRRVGHVLEIVGRAYLRAQGIILLLIMAVCMAGLFLLKSPYYILAGIGLGLLDALPLFGTGTVLLPWALVCFLRKKWQRGLILAGLYVVCYLIREILEAKLLGDRVGLSPLETLVSIYVGLQLFGIPGVLLGPVGTLVIKEFSCGTEPDGR